MRAHHRVTRKDWIIALAVGALLGAVFLGVGARVGMRVMALAEGQSPFFSFSGSLTVIALGAVNGALVAAIFLVVRILAPTRRWLRATLFWLVCVALMLRGLSPVTPLRLVVFLPLLGLHGALLHLYWCRIHLARRLVVSREAMAGIADSTSTARRTPERSQVAPTSTS